MSFDVPSWPHLFRIIWWPESFSSSLVLLHGNWETPKKWKPVNGYMIKFNHKAPNNVEIPSKSIGLIVINKRLIAIHPKPRVEKSQASWTPIFGGAMPKVRGNCCNVGPPAFPLRRMQRTRLKSWSLAPRRLSRSTKDGSPRRDCFFFVVKRHKTGVSQRVAKEALVKCWYQNIECEVIDYKAISNSD